MGLYIPKMKMPKNCYDCQIENDVPNCPVYMYYSATEYMEKRHPDCPLVEIPEPHGRLIDEDAHEQKMREWHCEECKAKKQDYNGVRCRACWVDDAIDSVSMTLAVIEAEGE